MMMLLSLVKKDFILIKKYWIFLVVISVAVPIFITVKADFSSGGFLSFFTTVIFLEYMLFGTVSIAEDKYKGSALLCATPYTRNALVKAKYIFIFAIFICIYIIYTITAFVTPIGIENLSFFTLGISLLIITVYFGISIPMQYKYGYEKTKYISMFIVFISPFIIPTIIKWLQTKNFNLHVSIPLPQVIENLLIYFLVLLIGFVSMLISINIYSKKEL